MKSLNSWASRLTTYCFPIRRLSETLTSDTFDVILAAGLFDYLDEATGRDLVDHLMRLTVPGGITAIANYHPSDPSRGVKDWLVGWPLIYRTESQLAGLFPESVPVRTSLSVNGSLVYAVGRRPVG